MRDLGVPRGVYTSTLAVNSDTHGRVVDETYRFYGRDISLYDETKAKAHALAENFIAAGLPLVIVQPGLVYGPGDNSSVRTTLIDYLTRRLPLIPKATAFSWGHVDDVARGHVVAGVTYIGSNERARTELGWTVRPLREGLEETLRHELALLGSGSVPRA